MCVRLWVSSYIMCYSVTWSEVTMIMRRRSSSVLTGNTVIIIIIIIRSKHNHHILNKVYITWWFYSVLKLGNHKHRMNGWHFDVMFNVWSGVTFYLSQIVATALTENHLFGHKYIFVRLSIFSGDSFIVHMNAWLTKSLTDSAVVTRINETLADTRQRQCSSSR